jgi:hypothetical protein
MEAMLKSLEMELEGDLTFLAAPIGSLSAMSFNYFVQEMRK